MNIRTVVFCAMCFVLAGASQARATYLIVENISDSAPLWGDCSCLQAEAYLNALFLGFVVEDGDTLVIVPNDYYPKKQVHRGGNFFLIDITKANPVAPGESYTSKKIIGLPDTGFSFDTRGDTAGFWNCSDTDACGGYSTGATSVTGLYPILPGVGGHDSLDFVVSGPFGTASVVRITFYPGNPPPKTK